MNSRTAKKIRKESRRQSLKRDQMLLPELKAFINQQPLWDRIRLAARLLVRKF